MVHYLDFMNPCCSSRWEHQLPLMSSRWHKVPAKRMNMTSFSEYHTGVISLFLYSVHFATSTHTPTYIHTYLCLVTCAVPWKLWWLEDNAVCRISLYIQEQYKWVVFSLVPRPSGTICSNSREHMYRICSNGRRGYNYFQGIC